VASRLRADGLAVATFDLDARAISPSEWTARDAGTASLRVDVTDEEAVAAGVSRVAGELGPPTTVLLNSAGVTRDNLLFQDDRCRVDPLSGRRTSYLGGLAGAR
jgi:3-oxoacyl-[acyl-carrier protein] reductase